MARPKDAGLTEPTTRHIHPAYAERLAELEAIGLNFEAIISVAYSTAMTLTSVRPQDGPTRHDYTGGWIDQAAFLLASMQDNRDTWIQDWRIRQADGRPVTPLLRERREWIESHVAKYRAETHQLRARSDQGRGR